MNGFANIVLLNLIIGIVIMIIIISCGCYLNRAEAPANWKVAGFGLWLLVFGILPFYGEA